jgi:hypothetical protein
MSRFEREAAIIADEANRGYVGAADARLQHDVAYMPPCERLAFIQDINRDEMMWNSGMRAFGDPRFPGSMCIAPEMPYAPAAPVPEVAAAPYLPPVEMPYAVPYGYPPRACGFWGMGLANTLAHDFRVAEHELWRPEGYYRWPYRRCY